MSFDFKNDSHINLDGNSPPSLERSDFNRVVIQVNGENKNDHVLAYIADFLQDETVSNDPVFDELVLSDEFEVDGTLDISKWFHQNRLHAGGSWYNGEVQYYTNRTDNSYINGGVMYIVEKKRNSQIKAIQRSTHLQG